MLLFLLLIAHCHSSFEIFQDQKLRVTKMTLKFLQEFGHYAKNFKLVATEGIIFHIFVNLPIISTLYSIVICRALKKLGFGRVSVQKVHHDS